MHDTKESRNKLCGKLNSVTTRQQKLSKHEVKSVSAIPKCFAIENEEEGKLSKTMSLSSTLEDTWFLRFLILKKSSLM